MLRDVSKTVHWIHGHGLLEVVQALLPSPIALDPNLYASKDHLLPTSKVDTQLYHISIVDRERFRLHAGLAQADMVEKRPGGALDVLDIPLSVRTPELAVSPAHHFRFEAYWR